LFDGQYLNLVRAKEQKQILVMRFRWRPSTTIINHQPSSTTIDHHLLIESNFLLYEHLYPYKVNAFIINNLVATVSNLAVSTVIIINDKDDDKDVIRTI
jgi:hypothetical protein